MILVHHESLERDSPAHLGLHPATCMPSSRTTSLDGIAMDDIARFTSTELCCHTANCLSHLIAHFFACFSRGFLAPAALTHRCDHRPHARSISLSAEHDFAMLLATQGARRYAMNRLLTA